MRHKVGQRHRPDPMLGRSTGDRSPVTCFSAGEDRLGPSEGAAKRGGVEVELETYRKLQQDGRMQRAVRERLLWGISRRPYRRATESVLSGYGSRLVPVMIESIELAEQIIGCGTGLGLDEAGGGGTGRRKALHC